MNTSEWMAKVTEHKDGLISVIEQFHPAKNLGSVGYKITAPAAEALSEEFRDDIRAKSRHPVAEFQDALTRGDYMAYYKASNILSETWLGAPESREVYSVPGFGLLCDLLDSPPELTPAEEAIEAAISALPDA